MRSHKQIFITQIINLTVIFGTQFAVFGGSVTITNSVDGKGIVLGTGTYGSGTKISLKAVPQVDWKFDHWAGVSKELATNNPLFIDSVVGINPKASFIEVIGTGRFAGGKVMQAELDDVVNVAAGTHQGLALRFNKTVVGWGTTTVPIGLKDVVAIAGTGYHSLALRSDGTVVGWGRNDYGQASGGLNDIVAIAAGGYHSLALQVNGTVVAWGANWCGQTTIPPGLKDVVAIGAGQEYSVALRSDGTVVGWGVPRDGQGIDIGYTTIIPPGLDDVVAIAAGGNMYFL